MPSDQTDTFINNGRRELTEIVKTSVFAFNTVKGYRRLFIESSPAKRPLISKSDFSSGALFELNTTDPENIYIDIGGGSERLYLVRLIRKRGSTVYFEQGISSDSSFSSDDEDLPEGVSNGDYLVIAFYAISYGTKDMISHIFSDPLYIGYFSIDGVSLLN